MSAVAAADIPRFRLSSRMPIGLLAPVAVALAMIATPRAAQAQQGDMRSLDVSRQVHDSSALRVEVRYGAGRLGVRAASPPVLYRVQLRYFADRAAPLYAFYPETHTLRVGIERQSSRMPNDDRQGDLHLDLTPSVPVDLSFELGAVEADLDLTGLRIGQLSVESGASEAAVRFGSPNLERMRELDLRVGAAGLRAVGLANANAPDVRVEAGVGDVDLDFSGAWTQDVALSVQVALGDVKMHVPPDVGVRVEVQRWLASVDLDGMTKRGDAYYSDNWDAAPRKLRVVARTTFGKLRLDRAARD
ncbi:MAG TPA: LiaF domain-containing protein [Gemmatimonadaceae bacterium]|nr:LiaF domain-containing protein [Gemmatimonadaceae bacterium]